MLIFFGLRVFYRTAGQGTFHCQRCGGDREYRHKVGRRWFTLFFIPVIPLNKAGQHVQCAICGTRYRMDVLSLPTAAQMQEALPAGTRAAAIAMLRAGGRQQHARPGAAPSTRSRVPAWPTTTSAALDADLSAQIGRAGPGRAAEPAGACSWRSRPRSGSWPRWCGSGSPTGSLSDEERQAAREIAAQLGMTPAQARGVISMTEEGASA